MITAHYRFFVHGANEDHCLTIETTTLREARALAWSWINQQFPQPMNSVQWLDFEERQDKQAKRFKKR